MSPKKADARWTIKTFRSKIQPAIETLEKRLK